MKCKNWAEEWWKCLLRIEEKENPIIAIAKPKLERYRAGQPNGVQPNSITKAKRDLRYIEPGLETQITTLIVDIFSCCRIKR